MFLGSQLILFQLTGKAQYAQDVKTNTHKLLDENEYTPGGLIFYQQWGPARHAANAAFLATQAHISGLDENDKYINFANSQINYLLGTFDHLECTSKEFHV